MRQCVASALSRRHWAQKEGFTAAHFSADGQFHTHNCPCTPLLAFSLSCLYLSPLAAIRLQSGLTVSLCVKLHLFTNHSRGEFTLISDFTLWSSSRLPMVRWLAGLLWCIHAYRTPLGDALNWNESLFVWLSAHCDHQAPLLGSWPFFILMLLFIRQSIWHSREARAKTIRYIFLWMKWKVSTQKGTVKHEIALKLAHWWRRFRRENVQCRAAAGKGGLLLGCLLKAVCGGHLLLHLTGIGHFKKGEAHRQMDRHAFEFQLPTRKKMMKEM